MVLVENYGIAIICCILCMICWGSWANTQKMAGKEWRFELFYYDMTIGLFLTALAGALTLGCLGDDGPTFFENLAVANSASISYAIIGGIVWNLGTLLLTAAIAIAGMSVGFPLGGGLAWVGGIIVNYFISFSGNPVLLFAGVILIILAIACCATAYKKLAAKNAKTPAKGFIVSACAGVVIMFFYGLVVKSLAPAYGGTPLAEGGIGTLTPYTAVFLFGVGILISTPIFNAIALRYPVEGKPLTEKDYFKGSARTHWVGILGGFIWMSGMVVSMASAGAASGAISYALSNAAPVCAMIWGIFVWKEFKGAPKGTTPLLTAMFILFILGLVVITLSNS